MFGGIFMFVCFCLLFFFMFIFVFVCVIEVFNGDLMLQVLGDFGVVVFVVQVEVEVEVDECLLVLLVQWCEVKKGGDVVSQVVDLDECIVKCCIFVKQYFEYQVMGDVFELLVDVLVEKGGFDF